MARSEFPAKVRQAAWARCKGRCEAEGCGLKLQVGKFHFDHDMPDGLGGKPTLDNCKVLCIACHLEKTTTKDNPRMTKADNQMKAQWGLKPKRGRGFQKPPPGYNYWTRKVEAS
jgi:5-methylcytosine-specific restriction protein A